MFLNIFVGVNQKTNSMYPTLVTLHSLVRWFVLPALLYASYRGWQGYRTNIPFTKTDNAVRHWAATITHLQLILGIILYTQSPAVKALAYNTGSGITEPVFFGIVHIALMLAAIVVITIGSAKAKRQLTNTAKFKTMFTWFAISLLIIFIAIPWPFSPLAQRPYLRNF